MKMHDQKHLLIIEQGIDDPVSGLVLRFEAYQKPDTLHQFKLTILGDVKCGNRELIFDENGKHVASGVYTGHGCSMKTGINDPDGDGSRYGHDTDGPYLPPTF